MNAQEHINYHQNKLDNLRKSAKRFPDSVSIRLDIEQQERMVAHWQAKLDALNEDPDTDPDPTPAEATVATHGELVEARSYLVAGETGKALALIDFPQDKVWGLVKQERKAAVAQSNIAYYAKNRFMDVALSQLDDLIAETLTPVERMVQAFGGTKSPCPVIWQRSLLGLLQETKQLLEAGEREKAADLIDCPDFYSIEDNEARVIGTKRNRLANYIRKDFIIGDLIQDTDNVLAFNRLNDWIGKLTPKAKTVTPLPPLAVKFRDEYRQPRRIGA